MPSVTGCHPDYVGSITIDQDILEAVGLRASDAVVVANCRSGARFETYVFVGAPGSRRVEINGAAAHLAEVGDRLIILHYALMTEEEYATHHPKVAVMNPDNTIADVLAYDPTPWESIAQH